MGAKVDDEVKEQQTREDTVDKKKSKYARRRGSREAECNYSTAEEEWEKRRRRWWWCVCAT